ncbi:electron transfer flavoprotein subunit alpha/FixB family protein [Pseudoglutamicibacter albus]|uniref:electron transfer flavoprotein subunit alpha/FixB family protein n=1 Tax=Pseudoglutamicibacter albus TaxID=98671 RepID=UPI00361C72E8
MRPTTATAFLTLVPGVPASAQAAAQTAEVVTLSTGGREGAQIISRTPVVYDGRPDVSSARVVVSGGRGTDGDFGPVEQLADALGGAVGSTRDATDEGWIPHNTQVGQTGATVRPDLYIAAGISGAVHHVAGMRQSGTIVAVNTDMDAPIFDIADFGIVGDLNTVLPQAAEAIRARKQQG